MKKYTHEKAHEEIDYIFKTLLPQRGMAERPEQIRLCHSILDAMLDGSIALCDAGTGIGKTFAYLTAGILHGKCRAAEGKPQRPILISTSSIALQSAIQKEYITNVDSGRGLIKCGSAIVPFMDNFPKNRLYKLMTTKPSDTDGTIGMGRAA